MLISSLVPLTTAIDFLLLILCLSAIWFYSYASYVGIVFFRRLLPPLDQKFHPPITILKPICGIDSDAYENLASFCQQDYPQYQLIFAVLEREDPGIEIVQKVIHDFPDLDIQLIIGEATTTIGANRKVSNLVNAFTKAKYDILVIADSDIRVGRDYLQRVIQPLKAENVGIVTCLYRSLAQGLVATLEALGTATEFQAGVLVSRQLEGVKFALGQTIVIRKKVLEAIGGFTAISDYLADDFQLGYLSAQAGYQVVLSDFVVEHVLATTTLVDSFKRLIRWARGVRVSRPWGYLGLIFTHGTATSLLFLIATGGSTLGWVVLATTWTIRLIMAWIIGVNILNDPQAKKIIWLVPLRDIISFAIWLYSFMGNTIEWRGRRLKLTKSGKLVQIS
jgi:ceramide glucosyltransferase